MIFAFHKAPNATRPTGWTTKLDPANGSPLLYELKICSKSGQIQAMSGANYKLVTPGNRRRLISAWRVAEFKIESLELKFRSFKTPSERGVWQIERSSASSSGCFCRSRSDVIKIRFGFNSKLTGRFRSARSLARHPKRGENRLLRVSS